ncbi:glycosyltransferase family 2 protein [Oerskovia enterophila]|uniref:UDP-Glc:alpha-D-GlcNAc-diphosphoundecaprenol beta-1,3-glucosyltransferase WfgD n=1 Tax=Oerskovia enterophila TaxID=43678 RepID=A0ABX2Y7U7_9CELL|nr:glycosyltransferase [Oerskovia enterophila]OCI32667.1 UDP-Glc:alpha-D-GlcNAc-diphosphoundecaprenol beta-1,3-glucosyltransferase WfgD [Oerskovia enterophila]
MPDRAADEPLVSVVLATNRGGPFLAEALASVAAQTYSHVELLVVDDGSPDPTEIQGLVASAGLGTVLRLEPSGVSAARNAGVQRSRGDLLAFLDDDDRWHPDRLRLAVEALVGRPDAVIGYCAMRTIDPAGEQVVAADQRAARDARDVVRGRTGIMLPNLVMRRSAFDAVGGFDPAYRQGEDLDLVLAAATLGPFVFVDAVLVDYRYHPGNTTRAYRDLAAGIRVILRARRSLARSAGRTELDAAYRDRLRANDRFAAWSAARAARADLSDRRFGAAVGHVVWAARFAPTAPVDWARERVRRLVDRER